MSTIDLNQNNFKEKILKEKSLVLVDFWAPWCGPCRMVGPVIDELAEEYEGKVVVGKVNVDEEEGLAVKHGVMSIPTVILFKNGKEMERQVGFIGKQGYEEMIKKHLE